MPARTRLLLPYGLALLVGIVAALAVIPLPTIAGGGAFWAAPSNDSGQALTGHLVFQASHWGWPLLVAQRLMWPHGISIGITDSNPAVSLAAKLWVTLAGGGPVNALGLWLALCWVLQPLAAVYALRGLGARGVEAAVAAAIVTAFWPAFLFRVMHVNLCGHFLILLALGLAVRLAAAPSRRRWIAAGAVLGAAVMVHPYLFQIDALVLAAAPVQVSLGRPDRSALLRAWVPYLIVCIAPVALFAVLNGTMGGGDKGFGFFSMNLLSPVWPQLSGIFGPRLPIIDATHGQYEGYDYLGAGILLLVGVSAWLLVRDRAAGWRGQRGLLLVLAGMTLLALSTRIYAGHWLILDLGLRPWEQLFGTFRVSARAFWPVGYALALGAIAIVARRLSPGAAGPLLAVAIVLQMADIRPDLARARSALTVPQSLAGVPAIPAGARILRTVPAAACTSTATDLRRLEVETLVRGARAGLLLEDVGFGRSPKWFNCEEAESDGLELPLLPGEVRVFTAPPAGMRLAALGPEAVCARGPEALVCSRGTAPPAGLPVPPGPALMRLAQPGSITGAALRPLLGFGWRIAPDGTIWSEGPRATLLFRVDPAASADGVALTVRVEGFARRVGGTRAIGLRIGRMRLPGIVLPDARPAEAVLRLPPGALTDGIARVAFDIDHPVDPQSRHLAAPVRRAGLRLIAVSVAPLSDGTAAP